VLTGSKRGNQLISSFFINSLLVSLSILIHYEILYRLSLLIPKLTIRPRFRVVLGLFGAMCAHVVEVWIFALGYYYMVHIGKFGDLMGNFTGTLADCGYFSFTTYTSLGLGDITPHGHIRFLVGLEGLTGFVLITWTASFMFLEMQKFWNRK